MRENVLNVTAVLADEKGTVITTGSRARKSSAGYDLTRLLIGSEGTLAVITEVTLKLHGIPRVSHAIRLSFDSIEAAAETARDTLNCGVTIGRCEMLDKRMIEILNSTSLQDQPWDERPTLLYELTGPSATVVDEAVNIVNKIAQKHNARKCQVHRDEEETKAMWRIRKEALWSVMSAFPNRQALSTDVCVPLSNLAPLISATQRDIENSILKKSCPIVAHAGDGNFHVIIMFDPTKEIEVKAAKQIAHDMAYRSIEMGGTCTGEHGVGVGKMEYLKTEMGKGSIQLMKSIKKTMDQQNILNPNKIVDLKEEE